MMTFVMPLETLFSINCGVEALCAFNPNGPSCWSRRRGVKQLAGRTVPGGPPVGPAYGRNFLQLARQCGRQRSRRARHRGRRGLIGSEHAAASESCASGTVFKPRPGSSSCRWWRFALAGRRKSRSNGWVQNTATFTGGNGKASIKRERPNLATAKGRHFQRRKSRVRCPPKA